jgi:hypothetical protein
MIKNNIYKDNNTYYSMKTILAFMIGVFFLLMFMTANINMVSASIQYLGTVKQSDCITLPQICNCTFNNITAIMYPNKSYITINAPMTKSGTYFNYTFCNTSVLGQYIVNGVGDNDGQVKPFNYYFLVTTSGYEATLTQGFMVFFIFGVVIILGILFFIIGIKTDMVGLKLFFLSMTVILMVFLIGYIVNVANITLGEFPSLTSGFTPLYILFIALLTVGAVGLIVYLIAYSFHAFYKTRGWRD